ncbi:MAG: purine-nucleoside phosphorylase [Candidatus Margulisiibacteriota bacterium]
MNATGPVNRVGLHRQLSRIHVEGARPRLSEMDKIKEASVYLRMRLGSFKPLILLTLGSGLGDLAAQIENPIEISYSDIPGFPRPKSQVEGHAEKFVAGMLNGVPVIAMCGRFHLYQEGITPADVVRPVRTLLNMADIRHFIVTNAAGGAIKGNKPGDVMLITDQIDNTHKVLPTVFEMEPQFADKSEVYSKELIGLIEDVVLENDLISIYNGVYWGNHGPDYETPAEVVMAQVSGGMTVGMSTVKETSAVARYNVKAIKEGRPTVKVAGFSYITNPAAGTVAGVTLDHDDVKAAAGDETGVENFTNIILLTVKEIHRRHVA